MKYQVKQGERITGGLQMAQCVFVGNPWAHIYVDCMGRCEPQQSIGLWFDSNSEADAFSNDQATDVFVKHGWVQRPEGGFLCPKCQQGGQG